MRIRGTSLGPRVGASEKGIPKGQGRGDLEVEIRVEFGEGKANRLSKCPVVGGSLDHLKRPVWMELKDKTGWWGRSPEREGRPGQTEAHRLHG